jgi:hypothetical protein
LTIPRRFVELKQWLPKAIPTGKADLVRKGYRLFGKSAEDRRRESRVLAARHVSLHAGKAAIKRACQEDNG